MAEGEPSTIEIAQKLAEALKVIKGELKEWREEGKQSAAKVSSLEARLGSLSEAAAGVSSVQQELRDIHAEVLRLKSSPSDAQATLDSRQNQELASIKQELDSLRSKLAEGKPMSDESLLKIQSTLATLSQKEGTTPEQFQSMVAEIGKDIAGDQRFAKLESEIRSLSELSGSSDAQIIKRLDTELERLSSETKSNIGRILDLKAKVEELGKGKRLPDEELEARIEGIKAELGKVAQEAGRYHEIKETLDKYETEFFTAVRKDLKAWEKESTKNAERIDEIKGRLDEISMDEKATGNMKEELKELRAEIAEMADQAQKYQKLKEILLKHNEEFEDVYSSIGKERVELDQLNDSIAKLKDKLVEWSERNVKNEQETKDLHKEMQKLDKRITEQNVQNDVENLTKSIEVLTDRIESLQKEERSIEESQRQLMEYDDAMKELLRKAVLATMAKGEFEEELGKLESRRAKPSRRQPERVEPAKPKESDVKKKLAMLRAGLQKAKAEGDRNSREDPVMEIFNDFIVTLAKAEQKDKDMLWNNAKNDISHAVQGELDSAKSKVASLQAQGKDVSGLNIAITKADIGLVSMETAFAIQNMEKSKEIVARIADAMHQIRSEISS